MTILPEPTARYTGTETCKKDDSSSVGRVYHVKCEASETPHMHLHCNSCSHEWLVLPAADEAS